MMGPIARFFQLEAAGGIVLFLAATVAMVVSNSPLQDIYSSVINLPVRVQFGTFEIAKPLLLWINDGLMAIFFFLVGLEIKREFICGQLADRSQAILPAIGAVGGMIVPALIYAIINFPTPETLNGWAIPAATDIAFALGVISLLGKRVPASLKILLTAIAIFDDLGAIIIIAIFYTQQLSMVALALALAGFAVAIVMNFLGVTRARFYFAIGLFVWVCVLKSGVHATLAGVALAMTIPIRSRDPGAPSPLKELEHALHPLVAFCILPIFAFANSGVSFAGLSLQSFIEPVKLGISAGLFIGKQVGIFGIIWLTVRFGLAKLPPESTWPQIYGVSLLCGIGFTMSLFIGGLAWEHAGFDAPVRLGVITGSLLSAIFGYCVLLLMTPRHRIP